MDPATVATWGQTDPRLRRRGLPADPRPVLHPNLIRLAVRADRLLRRQRPPGEHRQLHRRCVGRHHYPVRHLRQHHLGPHRRQPRHSPSAAGNRRLPVRHRQRLRLRRLRHHRPLQHSNQQNEVLTDTYGPAHTASVSGSTTETIRTHTAYTYDQAPPTATSTPTATPTCWSPPRPSAPASATASPALHRRRPHHQLQLRHHRRQLGTRHAADHTVTDPSGLDITIPASTT